MLRDCKEEQFEELKAVAYTRLSPNRIILAFISAFVYSGVTTAVMAFALSYSTTITSAYWPLIQKFDLVLLIVQSLFVLFFALPRHDYRFQKLQSIVLCLVFFKLSVDGYKIYFLTLEDRNSPNELFATGITILVGGLLLLVLATFRAIRLVEQGKLTQDGSYLYPVSKETATRITVILIVIMVIAHIVGRLLGNLNPDVLGPVSLLVIISILQYGMAIAWPEFFLIAYAKLKFPGFILKMPVTRTRKKRD
ncbi:hypothetical protein ACF3MZ_07195 [Paenibacillaceae bacterium WGS1546]|uniref:hypothetical protein n=1 Tax=Cohnella sp. WGS1546 TaxID=3366810 RepID=UPI00372D2EDF